MICQSAATNVSTDSKLICHNEALVEAVFMTVPDTDFRWFSDCGANMELFFRLDRESTTKVDVKASSQTSETSTSSHHLLQFLLLF